MYSDTTMWVEIVFINLQYRRAPLVGGALHQMSPWTSQGRAAKGKIIRESVVRDNKMMFTAVMLCDVTNTQIRQSQS